jgi:hypothetical protein
MARIHMTGKETDPKTGEDVSFTYAIEKHPKTKLVVQKSRDGYWFVYKLTGSRVVMAVEEGYKSVKSATAECIRYASWMEPDTSGKR